MRARHDHPLIHMKAHALNVGAARDVGGGLARRHAGFDALCQKLALRRQKLRIEERVQHINRQVERIEQQKRRIVTRRRGAMAIAEICRTEPRGGITPVVAQRHKFAGNLIHRSGLSSWQ